MGRKGKSVQEKTVDGDDVREKEKKMMIC